MITKITTEHGTQVLIDDDLQRVKRVPLSKRQSDPSVQRLHAWVHFLSYTEPKEGDLIHFTLPNGGWYTTSKVAKIEEVDRLVMTEGRTFIDGKVLDARVWSNGDIEVKGDADWYFPTDEAEVEQAREWFNTVPGDIVPAD